MSAVDVADHGVQWRGGIFQKAELATEDKYVGTSSQDTETEAEAARRSTITYSTAKNEVFTNPSLICI